MSTDQLVMEISSGIASSESRSEVKMLGTETDSEPICFQPALKYVAIKRKVDESSPRAPPSKKARFLASYSDVTDVAQIKSSLDIQTDDFQLEIMSNENINNHYGDSTAHAIPMRELSEVELKAATKTDAINNPKMDSVAISQDDSSRYVYDVYVYEDSIIVDDSHDRDGGAVDEENDSNDENHPANDYPDSSDEDNDQDDYEDDDSYGGFDPDDYLISAQDRLAFVNALDDSSDGEYEDDGDFENEGDADVDFAHHG